MHRRHPSLIGECAAVLAVGLVVSLASCGSSADQQTAHIEDARLKGYDSIDALAHDATAVVLIEATAKTSEGSNGGIPFTVSTVRVDQVLRGSVTGSTTVDIRQLGTRNSNLGYALVRAEQRYVAFLVSYRFPEDEQPEWLIVGESAGLFELNGNAVTKVDRDVASARLPAELSLDELTSHLG